MNMPKSDSWFLSQKEHRFKNQKTRIFSLNSTINFVLTQPL